MAQTVQSDDERWPIGKTAAIFSTVIIFFLALMDQCDRFIMASLLPYIKTDLGLTDAQTGSIMSIVNLSIALLVIPSGCFIDKWSRKKMIALMGGIWSVACGLGAFCHSLFQLLICRFFVGAGEAGYNPAASALLSAQYPKKHLSKALSIVAFGMTFGVPLGMFLGGILGAKLGWRHALGLVAVPGLFLSLLALLIKDYNTGSECVEISDGQKTRKNDPTCSFRNNLKLLIKSPSFWLIIIAAPTFQLVGATVSMWRPMYLIREAGFEPQKASTITALMLIVGLVATLLAGILIDSLRKKFLQAAAVIGIRSVIIDFGLEIYSYSGAIAPGSQLQLILLAIASIGTGIANVSNMTMLADLVSIKIRATAISAVVFAQNAFGMAVGPIIVGALSDHFGGSLQLSLFYLAFFLIIPFLCYVLLAFVTYKRDHANRIEDEASF